MATSAFSFRMFEEEAEEWELFKEQLGEFFKSAKIADTAKVSVLVNCLKAPTYKLLRHSRSSVSKNVRGVVQAAGWPLHADDGGTQEETNFLYS